MSKIYRLIIVLTSIFLNCSGNLENNTEDSENKQKDSTLISMPDTLFSRPEFESLDDFEKLIDKCSDSLLAWGFMPETNAPIHLSVEDYKKHWYLRHFYKSGHVLMDTVPSEKQLQEMTIRQISYKRNWKWILEEWEFTSRDEAEIWLYLIQRNHRIDDGKPPRALWLNGNKLYFVVATAAVDWSESKNLLIPMLTGHSTNLIRLLFQPIDIVEFKKKKGISNSSPANYKDKYKSAKQGFHYLYTLFKTPSNLPETVRFTGFKLYSYKFGNQGGDFFDQNELLVGLKATYEDPDLGMLDWVGKSLDDFIQVYGEPTFKQQYKVAYYYLERAIVLKIDNDRIIEIEFNVSPDIVSESEFLDKDPD